MPKPLKMEATVHAYLQAFADRDPAAVAALFAPDATVEDPAGTPPHVGHDAILGFYSAAMEGQVALELSGPVRVADRHVAFPFVIHFNAEGVDRRIDAIDTFAFDDQNRITEMRAFFGPGNMH